MREECLIFINEVIERETPADQSPKNVSEDNLLYESGLDSFGFAMLWVDVSDKYGFDIKLGKVDYDTYTVKDMIDVCQNHLLRPSGY